MNGVAWMYTWLGSTQHRKEMKLFEQKKRRERESEKDDACVSLDFSLGMYCICNCEGDRCFTKQTNIMKSYMRTMGPDYNNFSSFSSRSRV